MTDIDVLPERPYPGLRAFLQEEWAIFFGREEHADEVIARLHHYGLVLVHGASGCGKSSLVRAGVMPTLETNHEVLNQTWRTATMRPSEGLLSRLVEVLEATFPRAEARSGEEEDSAPSKPAWSDLIVKGAALVDHIEEAVREAGGGSFCLLVDQFEEIFRWARERSEAEVRLFVDFLKAVRSGSQDRGFHIILTMRSDYFGACATYDGFAEFLNPRQYLLPRMDDFGLLRAIHEPAELYGGKVDPAVSAVLLPLVKVHLDGLPVLQHALMRASDHARRGLAEEDPWVVTLDNLNNEEVGGAAQALAKHAEEIFKRATDGDETLAEALEWIFRALTDLDADRRAIRRPCRLKELIDVSGVGRDRTLALLKEFRAADCTFIYPYLPEDIDEEDELDDEEELDISHEALIRQWPKLCDTSLDPKTSRPLGWVYREFHDGLVWRSLVVQAEAFADNPKNLLSVATTEQRLPWFRDIQKRPGWTKRHALTERRDDITAFERQWSNVEEMMEASAENLQREHNLIKRLRKARNLAAFLGIATAISISIAAIYFQRAYEGQRVASEEKAVLLARNEQARNWLISFTGTLVEQLCEKELPSERQTCQAEMNEPVRETVTSIMQVESEQMTPDRSRTQYPQGKSE